MNNNRQNLCSDCPCCVIMIHSAVHVSAGGMDGFHHRHAPLPLKLLQISVLAHLQARHAPQADVLSAISRVIIHYVNDR